MDDGSLGESDWRGGREGGVGAGGVCMYALTGVYEGRRRHVVCIWYLRGFG